VDTLIESLAAIFLQKKWRLTTAESCTGGLVAASITELAGSSNWFERGYVTYSNQAKSEDIEVPHELIEKHGAVSEEVAKAMAIGAQKKSRSNASLSITGIAGPTGGTKEKPVGMVCFAWQLPNSMVFTETKMFSGDRATIRKQACHHALEKLLAFCVKQ
jgi:nicotinamide-nucleotide amidase